MEGGVNIMTDSPPLIVDGAEEAIIRYNNGEISAQELYEIILEAEVVLMDRSNVSEFKEKEDLSSKE